MNNNIKPKEAAAIIDSLTAGVVPSTGVQHIVVGRDLEAKSIVENLESVSQGQNVMKFWIGDFGAGKSFMFHLMKVLALKKKFVVASADFTPEIRLYSNDGRAVALYRQLMNNIAIQTKPEGGALPTLIEKWIGQVMGSVMEEHGLTLDQVRSEQNFHLVEKAIHHTVNSITDTGGFELGSVIIKYFQGYVKGDEQLCKYALKWLMGEYTTKREAHNDLGVNEIVNDHNFYDVLKCLCNLFVSMGYAGLVINMDEAINLYKIHNSAMRDKNYEKLLTLYNDCYQGRSHNMMINVAGTKEFLNNARKGLFSYEALKSRLVPNQYAANGIKDFSQPVIVLEPIGMEDIMILLRNLRDIFNQRHGSDVELSDSQIKAFMEELYNRPGAQEFLLPREVIREFLNVMNTIRQNGDVKFEELIKTVEVKTIRPIELLDDIEML